MRTLPSICSRRRGRCTSTTRGDRLSLQSRVEIVVKVGDTRLETTEGKEGIGAALHTALNGFDDLEVLSRDRFSLSVSGCAPG